MLNPVQEYAKARAMPISALVDVLQGRSDMVSLIVAHTALKDKTKAEIARKGAKAAAIAQAPKIVDKDIALAQGIAAMPTDVDVPMGGIVGNDGQMTDTAAGGGIVAFSNGNLVRNPRDKTAAYFQSLQDFNPSEFRGIRGAELSSMMRNTRGLKVDPVTGNPISLGEFIRAVDSGKIQIPEDFSVTPKAPSFAQALQTTPQIPPVNDTAEITRLVRQAQRFGIPGAIPPPLEDQGQQPQGKGQGQQAPGGIALLPSSALAIDYATRMTDAETMARKGMTTETPKTAKQFIEERDTLFRDAGYDFNLVKNQIKEVREEKEALKGDRKEAMNLRLIEAGLGILGGESPYAFVNIGKGATPALQGLAKDIKEIKKDSRALDREVRQLNVMQNELAAGRASYGLEALNKQADRVARRQENIQRSRDSIFGTIVGRESAKEIAIFQSQAHLQAANIGAAARRYDTDIVEKRIEAMPGKTYSEKLANYYKAVTPRATESASEFDKYVTAIASDPEKLAMLKITNPALHALVEQRITFLAIPKVTSTPTGTVRN